MLDAIKFDPDHKTLVILNQLLLPHQSVYENVTGVEDAFQAIRTMKVRGAPAIAIVGLLGLTVEINRQQFRDTDSLIKFVVEKCDYLCSSRPTAVNIRKECNRLIAHVKGMHGSDVSSLVAAVTTFSQQVLSDDLRVNIALGDFGARHLLETAGDRKLNILTHCNTGSLATSGYGTALGVIRSLKKMGKLGKVFCTETRPYNQGARLTAYELVVEQMDGTLICDDMVAALMANKSMGVDAVIVGADRVVANGDTANKIGTYQIAVLARHHCIPFYVACPLSTVDLKSKSGSEIPIEERPASEMKSIDGIKIAPDAINCWNPAFDVTPAILITGIVTEKGVVTPDQLKSTAIVHNA